MYSSLEFTLGKIDELRSDNIVIKNDQITGLNDPVDKTDIVNKEYLDETFTLSNTLKIINISDNTNVTYTPAQVISTRIFRISDKIVYDTLPTTADIIAYLGDSLGTSGTTFTFYIENTNDNNTANIIIINNIDLNIISNTNNIVIYPESTGIFNCIFYNNLINVYYSNNIYNNINNYYTNNSLNLLLPIKSYQLINNIIEIYSTTSYNIPNQTNIIFNILATTSTNITSELPTASDIITSLNFTNTTIPQGATFNFTVKLTSFISILPELYTFELVSPDTSITMDSNSLFNIEFSELSWKYASYMCIATGNIYPQTNNIFTCYCTNTYDIFTRNIN